MKKFIRIVAVVAAFAGFAVPGVVAAERGGGYRPPAKPSASQQTEVENDTEIRLHNNTEQFAASGNVEINSGDNNKPSVKESRRDRHHHRDQNTSVAGVSTGSVSNDNSTSASVSVSNNNSVSGDNNGPAMDTRRDGPRHSQSNGAVEVDVENDTEISICNSTSQEAVSGSVSINGASEVQNISTGDASNSNTTALTVSVSNDNSVE